MRAGVLQSFLAGRWAMGPVSRAAGVAGLTPEAAGAGGTRPAGCPAGRVPDWRWARDWRWTRDWRRPLGSASAAGTSTRVAEASGMLHPTRNRPGVDQSDSVPLSGAKQRPHGSPVGAPNSDRGQFRRSGVTVTLAGPLSRRTGSRSATPRDRDCETATARPRTREARRTGGGPVRARRPQARVESAVTAGSVSPPPDRLGRRHAVSRETETVGRRYRSIPGSRVTRRVA